MRKASRHFLKENEVKQIINDFCKILNAKPEQIFESKPKVELLETEKVKIFISNRIPFSTKVQEILFPTLIFREALRFLPKVVVDMGAVPHICNGADIMAPGITKIEGEFDEGSLLLIIDERHEKPIAIGQALFNSESMKKTRSGKVARNLHYVGDEIWSLLRSLL